MDSLYTLAEKVGTLAKNKKIMLATAESCTGGWIAQALTSVPGSSGWFDRGFVSYSNVAKQEMLGVQAQTLSKQGAVSEAVVNEMVLGALQRSQAQLAVAVSGVAGPGGGTNDKPVGTVWLAWGRDDVVVKTCCKLLAGDRELIRKQTVMLALQYFQKLLK